MFAAVGVARLAVHAGLTDGPVDAETTTGKSKTLWVPEVVTA